MDTQDKRNLLNEVKGDNIGDKVGTLCQIKSTIYYNEELDQVTSSLSPRTAHGMQDPPSTWEIKDVRWKMGKYNDNWSDGARNINEYRVTMRMQKKVVMMMKPNCYKSMQLVMMYLNTCVRVAQISKEYEAYDGRAEHVVWMEDFIDKGEHLNASSVADQILQMQGEARTKRGVELDEDAPPPHKTEEELWQEQAYEMMMAEENGEGQ